MPACADGTGFVPICGGWTRAEGVITLHGTMQYKIKAFVVGCVLALQGGWLAAQPPAPALTIFTEDAPPFQFVGPDGALTGYAVELVRAVQRQVGNQDAIKLVPWARGYQTMLSEPNVVLFVMARTAERNNLFHWVGPVLEQEYGLYGKADTLLRLASLEDAKRVHSIGVYRDDVRDQILTKAGFTNLDRINNNNANVQKLMSGRIDLYASSSLNFALEAQQAGFQPSDLKLVLPFQKIQVYIAMSKGTPEGVVQDWNAALKKLRLNGGWSTLLKKYYPQGKLPGPAVTDF